MKKLFCLTCAILMLLGCLTACSFNTNIGGALTGNSESGAKVDAMMVALADGNMTDAKSLLHPERSETSEDALTQIADFLDGRSVVEKKVMSTNFTTSAGTNGKITQEQISYQVSLDDGVIVYLNTVYLTNDAGSGFVSFQLVIGLV